MTLSSLAVLPEADRLFDRPALYEVSQFAPVARVLADPTLLAVPASAPWKTLQDFVDDAKKRPGQIPYGSSGPYGTLHVAMEMFAASAGIKLLHIPFRGAGPALTALMSGTVQALASAPGTLKQQVDDGKMRVLANWGAERIASFPDLPTFRELGYKDVEFYIWAGLFAQAALPAPIMTRLREAMAQAVQESRGDKNLRDRGQPGRLSGCAGIFQIRRRGLGAPDRGGEEDRQGGVGARCASPSRFFERANLPAAFVSKPDMRRCGGTSAPPNRKERIGHARHPIVLSLAMSIACGIALACKAPASAEENRGTLEQQLACTPDVWRLCFDQIPDATASWRACGKTPAALRRMPRGVRIE